MWILCPDLEKNPKFAHTLIHVLVNAMLLSGILWNIPQITCIFWVYTRVLRWMCTCIPKKIQVTSGIFHVIIWLAPWAGKMNQILPSDWLPERARWSYLVHSGLRAVSRKKNSPESHIINPLLTKLVWPRWLDVGLVLFFACLWTSTLSLSINMQRKSLAGIRPSWPHTWSITHMYTTRELCISVLYHAIEYTIANTISGTCVQCTIGRLGVILCQIYNLQLSCILIGSIFYGLV